MGSTRRELGGKRVPVKLVHGCACLDSKDLQRFLVVHLLCKLEHTLLSQRILGRLTPMNDNTCDWVQKH